MNPAIEWKKTKGGAQKAEARAKLVEQIKDINGQIAMLKLKKKEVRAVINDLDLESGVPASEKPEEDDKDLTSFCDHTNEDGTSAVGCGCGWNICDICGDIW